MFGAPIVALDVGTMNTKITTGRWEKDNLQIISAVMTPTPELAVANGHLSDPAHLADRLGLVLSQNKIKKGSVLFTADSTEIIMREIVMPWAPDKELQSMISFEVAKYFPVRIQDYIIQYHTMEEFAEGDVKKLRLLAAAMPKDMVNGYWRLAEGLGLKPLGLEMQAASMNRLLVRARQVNGAEFNRAATWALVDIGHAKLRVSFMAQGRLALTRTFAIGGKQVDQALAAALDTTVDQARALKHAGSLVEPDDGTESPEMARVREVLRTKVDDWVREIQPLFRYYLALGDNNRIDGILLYGGGAQIPGLAAYVQDVFNRPVQVLAAVDGVLGPRGAAEPLHYFLTGAGALVQTKAGDKS